MTTAKMSLKVICFFFVNRAGLVLFTDKTHVYIKIFFCSIYLLLSFIFLLMQSRNFATVKNENEIIPMELEFFNKNKNLNIHLDTPYLLI